jgi:hypothetical protein
MTRERYLEMCELMGSEPVESEIPVEFEDFPIDVQQAVLVYRMLKDEWEGFNGLYLGKSYIGLTEVLDYMEIDISDRKLVVQLIKLIDNVRSDQLAKQREQQKPTSS